MTHEAKSMTPEIAALYPKCPCLVYDGGAPVSDKIEGVDFLAGFIIAERANYRPEQIKLILRPLSDITEAEMDELEQKVDATDKDVPFNELYCSHSQITFYLLSRHFDIFGLIDAGLAIDKTVKP